jgi:hypothetical protein
MATVVSRSKQWSEGGVSVARIRRHVARRPSASCSDMALEDRLPALDRALRDLVAEARGELRERRLRLGSATSGKRV